MRHWQEIETTNDKITKIFLEMASHLGIRVYAVRDRPAMLADWASYSELLRTGVYLPAPQIHINMKCTKDELVIMHRIFTKAEKKAFESEPPATRSRKVTLCAEIQPQLQNTCCCNVYQPPKNHFL